MLDISKFSICSADSPTYLCVNGSSCIDLCIVSNNLVEKLETCKTDENVYLGSGAPDRGHVPLITTFKIEVNSKKKAAVEKINTNKICSDKWSCELDNKLEKSIPSTRTLNESKSLEQLIDEAIEYVTLNHGAKKDPLVTANPTGLLN